MSALTDLTIAAAREGLAAKRFSARELAAAHVEAMERAKDLNAYITPTPEKALEMAARSDARIAAGQAGAVNVILTPTCPAASTITS